MYTKYITVLSAAFLLGITACNSNAHDELAHHHHNHGGAEHNGEEIVLEPDVAKQLGVVARKVTTSPFYNVVKVSGIITDSPAGSAVATAPVAGVISFSPSVSEGSAVNRGAAIASVNPTAVSGGNSNAAAAAVLHAAKAELDRLTPLHQNGIVSTAEYNAALAAYNVAKANYSPAASGSVIAPVAGTVTSLLVATGQYVQPGQPVAKIASGTDLILTADLPQRYAAGAAAFTSASVSLPGTSAPVNLDSLQAKRIQNPANVASSPGYLPIYFSFHNNGSFVSGTPVEVFLRGAEIPDAIVVPLSAVSEQQGAYFVYIRLDDECYRKVPVTLGCNDGTDVQILSGLKPGQNVVVKGMVSVRLAESSAVVPEGHSHNH